MAYDGTGFKGFAANPGVRTVARVLGAAIERVVGHPVSLVCAGRTDAGVHAWGQVVSFDASASPGFDVAGLQSAVNRQCRPSVVVRSASIVDRGFDARRSAVARAYRYTVLNRPWGDPFMATTAWHVATPLDLPAMRLACDPLFGEHDFSSFCRAVKNASPPPSLVRRVLELGWRDLGEGVLRFDIVATSFCHQMVRSLVGTIVDVGRGRLSAGDMGSILRAADRHLAGQPAPPHGLCLWEVRYPTSATG